MLSGLQHKRTARRKRTRADRLRGLEEPVRGTANGSRPTVQDVGVNHGGADVGMAQEFLDGADVVSVFQEVSRKGVAQCVSAEASQPYRG